MGNFKRTIVITRPDDIAAYLVNDTITDDAATSAALKVDNFFENRGEHCVIRKVVIRRDNSSTPEPRFQLLIFNSPVTTQDNAAINLSATDSLALEAAISPYSTFSGGTNFVQYADGLDIWMQGAQQDRHLYFGLRVLVGFIPIAEENFTITIYGHTF